MKLKSTIEALRARCPSFKNRVFGAVEFSGLINRISPEELPACYVFVANETPATAQRLENSYYQEIEANISVVIAVSSDDIRGQSATDTIEDLKEEIFLAILGWSPTSDPKASYSYDGYQMLDSSMCPAVVFTQMLFNCTYAINVNMTRIPAQLEADTSELHSVGVDVDMISKDNKPDKQIDAKFIVKDLW